MPAKYIVKDFIGTSYNDFVIIGEGDVLKGNTRVLVKCVCGREYLAPLYRIIKGWLKNCGCSLLKKNTKRMTIHGLSKHTLYTTWRCMINRCHDEKNDEYKNYGARGVIVCDEWRYSLPAFYNWCMDNGWREGLQVDKDIKGTGLLYSPEMCIITTSLENQNNKRNSIKYQYKNDLFTLSQIARMASVKLSSLTYRVKVLKWGIDKSITTPFSFHNKKTNR